MSDQKLSWLIAATLVGSALAAWALTAIGLPGAGLIVTWWLFLIPSGIFCGYVMGRTLGAPTWLRITCTLLVAAGAASMFPFA